MNIRVATLCDFAQVREGLLSIMSAGITRVTRPQFPAPAEITVALMIELHPSEAMAPHEIRKRMEDADGRRIAEAVGAFQMATNPATDPGEMVYLPFVVNFREVALPAVGRYQVVIDPIEQGPIALGFRAGFPGDTPQR